MPRPCSLQPERVVEYPHWTELPRDLLERIQRWQGESRDRSYASSYSVAPGTKVGGWPDWCGVDGHVVRCEAGHAMWFLLTVRDRECDGGSWSRWLPFEEQHVWSAPYDVREPVQMPSGLFDVCVHLFLCDACVDHPTRALFLFRV